MKRGEKVAAQGRKSNIELFRIILMILLVASHYVHNSGILEQLYFEQTMSAKNLVVLILGMWGKPIINCFVLITGYFMCEKDISYGKWLRLLVEVIFYNVIINFSFIISGYEKLSLIGFLRRIIPITSVDSNFVSCYLIFFLLIPYLNIVINNM